MVLFLGAIHPAPLQRFNLLTLLHPVTCEVLFTPAEFALLPERDLSNTICLVFDVLRATSSMVTALAHGAESIIPVAEIPEAVALRRRDPNILLGGERNGVRITADLAGGVNFDFGNSPREFATEAVRGRAIAMTTTNGTRALHACARARLVLIGSFLNLTATVQYLRETLGDSTALSSGVLPEPGSAPAVLLVCGGTFERAAYEDTLCAGAVCDAIWADVKEAGDSGLLARTIYRGARNELLRALSESENGRRLLQSEELRDDVAFCAAVDRFPIVAAMDRSGLVRRLIG